MSKLNKPTLCLWKKRFCHYFLHNSVKNETTNNFWCTECGINLTLVPPHLKNVTTLPSDMQNLFTWSRWYGFPPNCTTLKTAGGYRVCCCTQSWMSSKKYHYRLRWHTIPVFCQWPCSASIPPMSQQRTDATGTDVIILCCFFVSGTIYHIILWIHRRRE